MDRKIKKVVFCSQEQIEYLRPYVQVLLDAIAEVLDNPKISKAFVSDLSSISDFWNKKCETNDDFKREYAQFLSRIEDIIGVSIDCEFSFNEKENVFNIRGDSITSVAKKIADG